MDEHHVATTAVGVRFRPAGKIYDFDPGLLLLARDDRVLVETERGPSLGTVATPPRHRAVTRPLRRVIKKADRRDLGREDRTLQRERDIFRTALEHVRGTDLPVKMVSAESTTDGSRVTLFFSAEDRLELRDLIADLSELLHTRVELKQIGARDAAKVAGGLGVCGRELCCTTWLPEFVPVSIKMAKDQGLVLNPSKVAGQCGRLKCCLVYEQATYAELRKGLPKLGKRVIAARGEGRVVEVDVLRQRIRVSYGPGDTEVVPAAEVKPLFPSGNQPAAQKATRPDSEDGDDGDEGDDDTDDGAADPHALPGVATADDAVPPADDDPSTAT